MKWNQELKYNILFGLLFVLVGETWNLSVEMFFSGTSDRWNQINLGGFLLFITFNIAYFTVYALNYLVFAPRFLKLNKVPHYILAFFIMVLCFAAVRFFLEEIVGYHLFGTHNYNLNRDNIVAIYLIDSTGYTLRPCLFSSLMYLFFRYKENTKLVNQLKIQQQEAQMAMLQSQIGPHFLFNTLNGFYSDLYDKNPEEAKGILKLSQLLRYITYEVKEDFMPLKKEIAFIKDYLYFYNKRYEDNFYLNLEIKGNIKEQKIPSLVLIHFIENVCKHGVIDDKENPAKVKIIIEKDVIKVATENKINTSEKYMDKGIGTENIKSRMKILFKDNYELTYNSKDNYFSTYLKMPL
ncbi:histidine kinase [Pseudotenacibaculum sp. MALMAid0570]|uniref:sensor histidine kinase n=1 Tax=Pseudotenacibaculum sp. MALMAid0570 TaxID=3143938 RepID=UPI0032DED407